MPKVDLTRKYACESCLRQFYPTEDQVIADNWEKLCFGCFNFGANSGKEEDILFEQMLELDHML